MKNEKLEQTLKALFDSAIFVEISSSWAYGWRVKIFDYRGDEVADHLDLEEIADWLHRKAIEHFPESTYALGNDEYWRRHRALFSATLSAT